MSAEISAGKRSSTIEASKPELNKLLQRVTIYPTIKGPIGQASRAALAAYAAEIENTNPTQANKITAWLHQIHEKLDRGEL